MNFHFVSGWVRNVNPRIIRILNYCCFVIIVMIGIIIYIVVVIIFAIVWINPVTRSLNFLMAVCIFASRVRHLHHHHECYRCWQTLPGRVFLTQRMATAVLTITSVEIWKSRMNVFWKPKAKMDFVFNENGKRIWLKTNSGHVSDSSKWAKWVDWVVGSKKYTNNDCTRSIAKIKKKMKPQWINPRANYFAFSSWWIAWTSTIWWLGINLNFTIQFKKIIHHHSVATMSNYQSAIWFFFFSSSFMPQLHVDLILTGSCGLWFTNLCTDVT